MFHYSQPAGSAGGSTVIPGGIGVTAATTGALPAFTYDNALGTIIANANGVLPAQDGKVLTPSDTLLVWFGAGNIYNGKFDVVSVGSSGSPFSLLRSADSNTSAELNDQVVIPVNGLLYAGHVFGQTTPDPILTGGSPDNIVYVDNGLGPLPGLYVTEGPAGAQVAGQIPYWTNVARRLVKGSSSFAYFPSTGLVIRSNIAAAITLNPWGTTPGSTSELRFKELAASGANYIGIKAPDLLAGNLVYVLPAVDPLAGQVMTGSAPVAGVVTLSWTTPGGGGGGAALSDLTLGVAGNTIDSTEFKQEWQWSTLAGTDALKLSSVSTAATGNAQTVLNIALSGANVVNAQTTYGLQVSNSHTGANSVNVAGYFTASGAVDNYGLIVGAGRVGIGTLAPARLLELKGAQPWLRMTEPGGQFFEIQGAAGGSTYIVSSSGPMYFYPDSIQTLSLLSTGITLHKNTMVIANLLVQAANVYFEIYNTTPSGTGDWYLSSFSTIKRWMLQRYDATAGMFYLIPDTSVISGAVVSLSSAGLMFIGGNNVPSAFVDIAASVNSNASLRIRSGVAPGVPNDGDVWYDGADLKMRIGVTTKTFTLV